MESDARGRAGYHVHMGIGERILENRGDRCFDGRGEGSAESDTLSLIPRSPIQ